MSRDKKEDFFLISEVSKRFAKERKRLGLKQSDIAAASNTTERTVVSWESDTKIPTHKLGMLAELGMDLQFIVTGECKLSYSDNMIREDVASYPLSAPLESVPLYNVRASAGSGLQVYEEEEIGQIGFRKDLLAKWNVQAKDAALIQIAGDSMAPRLNDNDMALVNLAKCEVPLRHQVTRLPAFVLLVDDQLIVKYLVRTPDGGLQASSHNSAYAPFEIKSSELDQGMYKIVGQVCISCHEWL